MESSDTKDQTDIKTALNLRQRSILDKIVSYLKKGENRDKDFIAQFNKGYCAGLVALWLYAKWLQTQPNPENKPRDDYTWFKKTEELIAGWDEKRTLTKEEATEFERFISHIEKFQYPGKYLRFEQGDLDKILEDTKNRKPTKEYSIASLFTFNQLCELLNTPQIIKDGKLILISSHRHAIGLFKLGGYFYIFDPNNPRGEIKTSSFSAAASAIYKPQRFIPDQPSPIAFRIFSFYSSTTPYPNQAAVLKTLGVTSGTPFAKDYGFGLSGLSIAAKIGCLESVKFFLSLPDLDIDQQTFHGKTALAIAASRGYTAIAKLLLEKNANPNIQDDQGLTPIIMAAGEGHLEIVRELLRKGANPNTQSHDFDNCSALMEAATEGHVDIVKELLKNGADPNLKDDDGNTALILAVLDNKPEVVKKLLAHGAKTDIQNKTGKTALAVATAKKLTDIVSIFLKIPDEKLDITPKAKPPY